jgi:hypothetical protein
MTTVAALLLLAGVVCAPVWILRRARPAPAGSAAPAGTPVQVGGWDRWAPRAWRTMLVLGVLLLAFAWVLGELMEEVRLYAELQGMPVNDRSLVGRIDQRVVLAGAGVLLLGAALLRWSPHARRL